MITPSEDELAAIAAAYAIVVAHRDAMTARVEARPETSRWSLAARVGVADAARARFAARSASRWSAAGRLDG